MFSRGVTRGRPLFLGLSSSLPSSLESDSSVFFRRLAPLPPPSPVYHIRYSTFSTVHSNEEGDKTEDMNQFEILNFFYNFMLKSVNYFILRHAHKTL